MRVYDAFVRVPPPKPVYLVALLIAGHAAVLVWNGRALPLNVDEPARLAAGLYTLRTGRCDLYPVNPPLISVLAAAPVDSLTPNWDFSGVDTRPGVRREWVVGEQFAAINPDRAPLFFSLARGVVSLSGLLGAWVCWRWGRELHGDWGGVLTCGLWCTSPLTCEYGARLMTDVPAAACGLLGGWTLHRWLKNPRWEHAVFAGLSLGLALNCKFTWLAAFVVWPLVWGLRRSLPDRRPTFREGSRDEVPNAPDPRGRATAAGLAAILGLGLCVLNAGYGFSGTFTPLGEYRFVSRALSGGERKGQFHGTGANRFAETPLAALPVPLPADAVIGIDLQRVDFEPWEELHRRTGGPPWAYLSALLVRERWAAWAALLFAAIALARGCPPLRDACCVLLPAAALLAVVSANAAVLCLPRYALPGWAFLLVFGGGAASAFLTRQPTFRKHVAREPGGQDTPQVKAGASPVL